MSSRIDHTNHALLPLGPSALLVVAPAGDFHQPALLLAQLLQLLVLGRLGRTAQIGADLAGAFEQIHQLGAAVGQRGQFPVDLQKTFLPRLLAAGVDQQTIDQITIKNPARVLTLVKPSA